MRLSFYATAKPSPEYLSRLKAAARAVFPNGVTLIPASKPDKAILLLDPCDTDDELTEMFTYAKQLVPWPEFDDEVLYFDIETHNAERRWDLPPEKFFRLGQYAWGVGGKVCLTEDYDELRELCYRAKGLVAHNGHSFDFGVMLGDDALAFAREGKLFDTMVYGNLAYPAPFMFSDRKGHKHYMEMAGVAKIVPHTMKWLSLDNLAFQMGLPGKVGDLKELAARHNPPKTPRAELDFGLIPTDDPEFLAYAEADVEVLQGIAHTLIASRRPEPYDWREQLCAAINAQISRNGFCVDTKSAQQRVDELEVRKETILADLSAKYGFPTEGKAPWSTKAGKQAILDALADFGIVPKEFETWPFGKTGPSLSGSVLKEHCEGTDAEEFAEAIATLAGQRPLAAQALDCTHSDGRVHPDITSLQRSGRMSVTRPSLGTWTSRGDNSTEKAYFLADPGCLLVEFDMSNADARAVAAMARDYVFAERFEDGVDAHEMTGRAVFGDELYDSDPKTYRQKAKVAAHGWNYGMGYKKLSRNLRISLEHAEVFTKFMAETYPKVIAWQDRVRDEARIGYAINEWGRRMPVDEDRAYTQAPALHGQSSTREALFDGLIKMPDEMLRMLKITIHDAVVFSFPKDRVEELSEKVRECMEFEWNDIKFPLGRGPAASNWFEASHG